MFMKYEDCALGGVAGKIGGRGADKGEGCLSRAGASLVPQE